MRSAAGTSNTPCTRTRLSAEVPSCAARCCSLPLLLGGRATRCPALVYLKENQAPCPTTALKSHRTPTHGHQHVPASKRQKKKKIYSNAHRSGSGLQENTSLRADKRGVAAGGDPSGSRRSISIQKPRLWSRRTTRSLGVKLREVSAQ